MLEIGKNYKLKTSILCFIRDDSLQQLINRVSEEKENFVQNEYDAYKKHHFKNLKGDSIFLCTNFIEKYSMYEIMMDDQIFYIHAAALKEDNIVEIVS